MKKTVAVLLVAVMLLTAVGCGASYTKEQVVGNWKVTKVKGDDDVQNLLGAHLNLHLCLDDLRHHRAVRKLQSQRQQTVS